jgi:serine O-acetyltransferase
MDPGAPRNDGTGRHHDGEERRHGPPPERDSVADPAAWADMRQRLRADAARLRRFQVSKFGYRPLLWFIDPSWWAVLLHRLSALAWRRGHRKTGRLLMQLNSLATGTDIHPASDLGPGLLIPSPCGVTLSCKAGADLTVMALAGVGGSLDGPDIGAGPGLPVLGNGVTIGPFCGLQKAILVGDGAVIEGGAGALKPLPQGAHSILATAPLACDAPPPTPPPHADLPPCPHHAWSQARAEISADIDRYLGELSRYDGRAPGRMARLSALLMNPVLAIALHRVAHWQHARGHRRTARFLAGVNRALHRLTITPESCIGGGLFMPHLAGTMFCGTAGRRLTLYANGLCAPVSAAIGPAGGRAHAPLLGDDVTIGGHAAVIGPVTIGSRVRVATKLQATSPVPDDADAFTPMGRFTERREPAPPPAVTRPPPRRGAEGMRSLFRADRARLREATGAGRPPLAAMLCSGLHRAAHAAHRRGHRRTARWAWLANQILTGADISPGSEIGPGLLIPHPAGIAIHATVGARLTLLAQTGIGPLVDAQGRLPPLSAAPLLGDDVTVGHHGGVYGDPILGSRVQIGPGCIASFGVADDVALVARPMRVRRASAGAGAADQQSDAGEEPTAASMGADR